MYVLTMLKGFTSIVFTLFPLICLGVEMPINIEECVLESLLQQAKQLKGNEFMVWIVQDGIPVQTRATELNYEAEYPHIILERVRHCGQEWNLCYWIPKYENRDPASTPNYFAASAYTMALDQILSENSAYHYSREILHRESQLFKSYFTGDHVNYHQNYKGKEKSFVLQNENDYISIIQGASMMYILQTNNCAVLYSENVYVFCGNVKITRRLRQMAHTLGNLVLNEVQMCNPGARYIQIDYGRTGLSEQQLDDISTFYKKAQFTRVAPHHLPRLDYSADTHGFFMKRIWGGQWIHNLHHKTIETITWYSSIVYGPLQKSMLKANECHLVFQTELYRELRLYLWIGKESTKEERIRASVKVEQTVKSFYDENWSSKVLGQLAVIVDGEESVEFKAIFMDWIDEENGIFGQRLYDYYSTHLS